VRSDLLLRALTNGMQSILKSDSDRVWDRL